MCPWATPFAAVELRQRPDLGNYILDKTELADNESFYPEKFPDSAKTNPWILNVTDIRLSLKENDVLFRDDAGRELKKDYQFPFFVALDEPGVFERKPLLPALNGIADFVSRTVDSFDSLFP
jgi:hypothetical protein